MMMHPDFRALLDAYTPDELASIFREELEALQIPYTTNSSENSYFAPLSTVKAYIRPVDYQKQPFLSQNSVSITSNSTRSNSVLVKYNWISLCDLGRIA